MILSIFTCHMLGIDVKISCVYTAIVFFYSYRMEPFFPILIHGLVFIQNYRMHHPPQIRGHCVLDCGKNCGGEMGCIIMMLCCGFRHSVEYSLCVSVNVTTSTTFASLEDKPRGKALRPKSWGSSPRDLKKPALFSEGLSVSNSPR